MFRLGFYGFFQKNLFGLNMILLALVYCPSVSVQM